MNWCTRRILKTLLCLIMFWPSIVKSEINSEVPDSIDQTKIEHRPLRVGVVGLVHTHVHWILGREDRGDIEIVGIVEPNRDLAMQYSKQHGYSMDLVFNSLEEMISAVNPEAVTAFNTIYDHLEVVRYCAPRGIHVMVEKPLAVNYAHAQEMVELARKHQIHLLTNYETSWYGSTYDSYKVLHDQNRIGNLKRMVFNTGHPGPIEIGCNPEFLEWLTDPDMNGGGALTDFGCYGANIATWMLKGQTPETVTCVTRQLKPHLYPWVEDDATIVITYPETQVIIQASWNWSHNRKDMEIYGTSGYVICKNASDMLIQESEETGPVEVKATQLPTSINDPFALLEQVVRNNYEMEPFEVSSPENNIIVMQILEAAKHAAKAGKTVVWKEFYKD